MDIETVFDASYARVLERQVDGRGFFEAFYERFVAASPEVAEKFRHTDMHRQQAMLKKSFYHLLTSMKFHYERDAPVGEDDIA